jgi:hypothetical protein
MANETATGLLGCAAGDKVERDGKVWDVEGFHTISGDLWVRRGHELATVTAKTARAWRRADARLEEAASGADAAETAARDA